MEKLTAALDLGSRGFAVFPVHTIHKGACTCFDGTACSSPGKHPVFREWDTAATTEPETIRRWWSRMPRANIGIACGPSGLLVLDCDPRHEGDESLFRLQQDRAPLPSTPTVLTGGGGTQFYFLAPPVPVKNAVGIPGYPGLDVRSAGGLVVGVGSLHISGRRYEWEVSAHPDDVPLAPCPSWLSDLLARQELHKAEPLPEQISSGCRNASLFSAGCAMRRKGMSEAAIFAALWQTNLERCDPPLDEREVHAIASSAARYDPASEPAPRRVRWSRPQATGSLRDRARTVSAEEVRTWLR